MDTKRDVLWQPPSLKKTTMDEFRSRINQRYNLNLGCYGDVYKWSVENYSYFWKECWEFVDIRCSKSFDQVVDITKGIADVPIWFEGSLLNFAENLLRYDDDNVALYATGEGQEEVEELTFKQLRRNVTKYAAAMRKMGIKKGDRVVGYISNCTAAIEAMLAVVSIGAIWSSTSPDFGVKGVLSRFSQIQPKLIFSVNAVVYNGKTHNHFDKLKSVVDQLEYLEKVVVVPFIGNEEDINMPDIKNSVFLSNFLESGRQSDGNFPPLMFEQLPFNHPLYIMYSSGTTGQPKCMVHSAGGTLIQHLKEHILHGNMTRDDKILYYTTTGWMMWNWLVSSLAVGASVVLYDGSPLLPTADVLWNLVDKLGITILGTGAKWLSVLMDKQVYPAETHNLSSLHTILSTGSPLNPRCYDYVYNHVKKNIVLGSITGGTDIISCFAGQNWTVPVVRGEIQARNLGMAVECWNDKGEPVEDKSGEMICTKPFPSQPTHFWNDKDCFKYKKAYFSKFQGVWAHGDFCTIVSSTGGIVMQGRSDGTLNPNGVRFGSSDIYSIIEPMIEIEDSLCIPQYNSIKDERVILFLKVAPNYQFNNQLIKSVKTKIRQGLSARHVPAVILCTQDIPYTISGKKVEVAVRKIIAGEVIDSRDAFRNPDSLDLFQNLQELQDF